jgi:hypothetical protein
MATPFLECVVREKFAAEQAAGRVTFPSRRYADDPRREEGRQKPDPRIDRALVVLSVGRCDVRDLRSERTADHGDQLL